ncbi:MAG: YSIRK-type signal peptide-containing protein, partial [Limosilactobacillus sp.]|uniref:mucin-binding protein n=1 Tax=Limosilactobacillus sp. TaxID=2773925 RepID=UPI0023BF977A
MLSHNNWRETVKQQEPKQQRFTIKKLTVGVASVLLGFTFAETTTASADTDVNTENHLTNITEHSQIANSASTSTLQQSVTDTAQQRPASAVNPVGDVKTSVADNYEAAVSSAVKQENEQSVAQTNTDKTSSANSVDAPASSSIRSKISSQPSSVTSTQQAKENQAQPVNYAVVFASLANNATEQAANTATVTDWNGLQSALNDISVNQVNVQGNLYAYGDATVNHNVTINGVDGASINFGNSVIKGTATWGGIDLTFNNLTLTSTSSTGAVDFSQTNNKNTVTFNNVNAHGASLYNGGGNTDVYIRGNVTSDFDGSAAKPTVAQLNNALGSYPTANINNWQNANIVADNVYVDQGATLTLTRSVVGDGIDIVAGNKAYKNSSNAMGNVNVGVNASLNITLMNGTQQNLRTSEQATNIENASAAIRAYRNGSFTTGDSAQVTLNVGHGRGIVFDEPFGGSTSIQLQGNPETNWYNNRAATNYRDYDHNEFKLGNSTKFYLHGRDGVLLGNRATMITGENSQLTFDNGGNGSGLTVDAYARVEISPHSVVLMHSDGKNHSGVWNGGNYIGLGEDGHFTVDHDATFRYILVNRNTLTANGTNVTNFYDDNFNITSVKSNSSPLVTIGDNAVFDGQSDYRNIFGEILSFSYNNAPAATTMNIHGARYINFQKYEATTPGAFQNVTTYDPDGKHTGNLFYSWPHNTWTVNGNTYNAYKWDDEYYAGKEDTYDATNAETIKKSIDAFTRDASQTWSGITDLNLDYNMHERVGGYVNNDATMSNHGVAFGAEAHGFDPEYSQRVALVATNIPTEDTQTEQQKTDYDVILKYNKDLPAGTVKVTQQGVNGLVRKTETTYYIVNGATGEKTLDTSKGGYNIVMDADGNVISRTSNNNPGHSTTIAEINKMVPEIIEVGPQKVTLNYVDKTSGKILKTTTVLGNPIKMGTDNVVEFDKDGNVIPNSITEATFTDNGQTVAEIIKGYTDQGMTVANNTLATAIKDGTAQYDVKGVTRDSLSNQQAIPANGPIYEIDLNEAVKRGSITVTYYDETTGQIMTQYTYNSGEENVGTPITYSTADTIKKLENQGYVLVNDGFASADVTDITAGNHSYVVTVKHGIEDIDKNNPHGLEVVKTVTRTVNYTVNGKASDQLPMKTESAGFTATGYWDKVLKQLVDVVNGQIVTENGQVKQGHLTWTADGSTKDEATLNGYPAPSLDGYHVDAVSAMSAGQNVTADNVSDDGAVKNITVTNNSNNIDVTVDLVSNGTKIVDQQNIPGSQTVKFVDENGNELAKAVVDHTDFTYSGNIVDTQTGKVITQGKWNQESHQFGTVTVPVIKGYVADSDTAGGLTATLKDPNVTQTIIYHQVGKIIPVGPSGKPIPNVPQPPYTNDPNNPTKVTPNEPVPDIPGYVPSVPTVTPNDPTKNTTVIYNNTETAIVNYVDQSENDKLITTSGDLTGPSGTKIDYSTAATIKQLEDQGYVFVSSNYPADATFDDDMGKTQVYTVVMKHGTTTYNPEKPATPGEPINPNYPDGPKVTKEDVDYSKDVTSTVHYEGAGGKTPANNIQNAQWTRSITVDNITGKIISTTEWKPNKTTYDDVKTPVVEGYHADKAIVPAQKVTMDDLTTTVTYYPNGHIIPTTPDGKEIPNVPHPQYPTSPNDPTTVAPNEPVPEIPGYTPTVPTVTPTDPGKDTPVVYKQIQQADLTIVDQDNDNKQIEVSGIMTAFMEQGDQGTAITFNGIDSAISSLEKIGYVYVSSTFKQGDLFDNQDNQPQRYIIVMKHGIKEVNKNNPHDLTVTKTITRTVNYTVNGKASDQLPMKTESAGFTATGYWDKVLKQLVDVVNGQIVTENGQVKQGHLTWTANGSTKDEATLNGYPTPSLDGYHVDAVFAASAGQNVTADNVSDDGAVKNITVTNNSN